MDPAARLTLDIVRFVQMPADSRDVPERWSLIPSYARGSRDDVAEWFASAPKPLVIGPLTEPGAIAVWTLESLDGQAHTQTDWELRNASAFLGDRIRALSAPDDGVVLFETVAGRTELTVAELRRWWTEYMICCCGIALEPPTASDHAARLFVLRSDRSAWSPGRAER